MLQDNYASKNHVKGNVAKLFIAICLVTVNVAQPYTLHTIEQDPTHDATAEWHESPWD